MTALTRIVVGGALKKLSTSNSNFRPVGAGPTSDQDALRVRGMSKTFPGTRALVDVDLTVRAGEVHAVVGQNGSGKSTLIKVLAGYHDADPGASVEVGGRPFQLGSSLRAHAAGMRFVHQDLGLVLALDAVDNLALGVGYETGFGRRIRWRRQRERATAELARLGYQIDVDRPVEQLAAVEKTAIAIARAVTGVEDDIALLVLDEPTAAMPHAEVERLLDMVRQVSARGTGILYVSHHLDEVFAAADRVTVLRDGRKVATASTAELDRRDVVELMTGSVVDQAPQQLERVPPGPDVMRISELSSRRLKNFSLRLSQSEVVGVSGITGSGRDELCPAIFGARPRKGGVFIGDRPLEPMRPDRAVDLGVGFVPADRRRDGLVLNFGCRENLTLSHLGEYQGRLHLNRTRERHEAAVRMDELGVKAPSTETVIEVLSGGNQQKVVLGRSLWLRPRVLLLDEPTQGVDVAAKADVHRLIDETAAAGTSVLVCSSDEEELARLCDRVIVLDKGEVVAEMQRPHISARRIAHAALGHQRHEGSAG
jgi:ribose transport system ATP-binding protein